MKLLAVCLCKKGAPGAARSTTTHAPTHTPTHATNKGSVRESIIFLSRLLAERTEQGSRSSVRQEDFFCHVLAKFNGLTGVVVADAEYPSRAAYCVLSKAIEEFETKFPAWKSANKDFSFTNPSLDHQIAEYQDPAKADKLLRIQKDLEETKLVLHKTIDEVLERGEKLDTLIDKSSDLSGQSKMFYKTAKKTNSCCVLM